MRLLLTSTIVLSLLGGCAILDRVGLRGDRTPAAPAGTAEALPQAAEVASAPLEPTQAEQNAPASGSLGVTIATLGAAGDPGLWLKTPLVSSEQPGRIVYDATGGTANVTLRPIQGPESGGSRISLDAMRAIGASLTDLAEIEVFAGTS